MNQDWVKKIYSRTKEVPVASGRSKKWGRVSFEDLLFMPAQLSRRPVDYYREKVEAELIVGRSSRKPFRIKTPIIIGAMSFGALSREAKIALAKGSALAGTCGNTGEGGMLPEEREFSNRLIIQYSTGRFGISEEVLKKADAVEIKIGQGAKAGMGGLLPGSKVTEEIAKVRNVPVNKAVHSPPYHSDIKNDSDLRNKVSWLRKITDGAPVIIKLGGGDVEEDVKIALKAQPDVIAIDGMEGGTGASPEVMLDEVGLPTIAALVKARNVLDEAGAEQELWIGGGFNTGSDIAKALALGADAVFLGTSLLIAMGCLGYPNCGICRMGKCPKGIATQEPELRKRLNIETASENVANFIKNCTEEAKMIAAACGENNVHKLSKDRLRALTLEMAKIAGVKSIWQ